jgi:GNAT superfamily N-acetyltransferase
MPDGWDELAAFFGPSGAYSNCWCTWFRQSSGEYRQGCQDGGNRALLERLTSGGAVPGLLAYEEGEPVGWVSIARREEFSRVLRSPYLRPDPDDTDDVWSAVCFWVPRAHRGKGVAKTLLDAAVDHARSSGATAIEGYPVDTNGAQKDAASIYTGTVGLFEGVGFTRHRAARPGTNRVVMRRRP